MRNRFKVQKKSVMRDKNYFLLEGTLTSGSIAVGMNLQYSDYHGNVELLPIVDIGFARIKKAGRVTELMVLCIPYEDGWMLSNYQKLELEGKSFSVSRPLFRYGYQRPLTNRSDLFVAEPRPVYEKKAPVKKNRTASAGKKSKASTSRGGVGVKRGAKKKK